MKDETKNLAGKKRSHQCLQSVEVFAQLPSNVVAGIAEQSTASTFAAKEKIFSEGERATHGCIVMSGRVAMLKSSPNGKELIFQLFTHDKDYPNRYLLLRNERKIVSCSLHRSTPGF